MADYPQEIVLVHLEYLRARMDGVIERLDKQNGKLETHATAIAVLETRAKDARMSGSRWGAGAGTLGGFLGGLLAGLFKGGQ